MALPQPLSWILVRKKCRVKRKKRGEKEREKTRGVSKVPPKTNS